MADNSKTPSYLPTRLVQGGHGSMYSRRPNKGERVVTPLNLRFPYHLSREISRVNSVKGQTRPVIHPVRSPLYATFRNSKQGKSDMSRSMGLRFDCLFIHFCSLSKMRGTMQADHRTRAYMASSNSNQFPELRCNDMTSLW